MKFIKRLFIFAVICIFLGVATIFGFYQYVKPELPDVATLKHVELQTPMQVFTSDGKLIAQFGEKRRIPLSYDEIPQQLVNALVATEDSRFYEHPGVDPIGIARAALVVLISGHAKQGASTITQQLARNFFLSNEKKIMRKVKEIFIAIHIEQLLSKQEIMELYINKIFLGYRSYGFGAAARVYFGKDLKDCDLSELAMLAGLPKAPSTLNPLYSLQRATNRRNVVLRRMLDEKYITQEEFEQARSEKLVASYHGAEIQVHAPYVAEIARSWLVSHYGEEQAYNAGMKIYMSVNSKLQQAANEAAINNVLAYDQRHGFRGAVKTLWKENEVAWDEDKMDDYLSDEPIYGELYPAIVTSVGAKSAQVRIKNRGAALINWDNMKWARRYISDYRQGPAPEKAADILQAGDQIWVQDLNAKAEKEERDKLVQERLAQQKAQQEAAGEPADNSAAAQQEALDQALASIQPQVQPLWSLSQVPNVNTAFVSMDPETGNVLALVGGFNYVHNKFNRATHSLRQVGSSIKPFIYSSAIDKGLTLATLINDAPINKWDESQGTAWRPKNSPPTYLGPTRLRIGLATSKNVMAVRTLRAVGLERARHYLTRFGFDINHLPKSETLALGAGSLTPLQMAQGYSVFANGGYHVDAHLVDRVEDPFGKVLYQADIKPICRHDCDENTDHARQVITPQNAFLVREMMYSNVWGGGNWSKGTGWNGTGWRAQRLHRRDIGGKTGTTNDSKDAWYNGFGPDIVAISWVGFDDHSRNLGRTTVNPNLGKDQTSGGESGAKTAQPAWIDFMRVALQDRPPQHKQIPDDIVRVRIDRATGLLTHKADSSSMFEYFIKGTEPTKYVSQGLGGNTYSGSSDSSGEELF